MRAADYIVDVGPGAGSHGGEVVAAGTLGGYHALRPIPYTGQYLSGAKEDPRSRTPGARGTASP